MELFTKLFGDLLAFVYHCFDRIVIHGYLSALSRPEQVVHFFRQIVGVPVVSKEILSERTANYQSWVDSFARNHHTPIEWAERGVTPFAWTKKRVYQRRFKNRRITQLWFRVLGIEGRPQSEKPRRRGRATKASPEGHLPEARSRSRVSAGATS